MRHVGLERIEAPKPFFCPALRGGFPFSRGEETCKGHSQATGAIVESWSLESPGDKDETKRDCDI